MIGPRPAVHQPQLETSRAHELARPVKASARDKASTSRCPLLTQLRPPLTPVPMEGGLPDDA
eukprot:6323460-Alexandrium_andersonii.AAC.1